MHVSALLGVGCPFGDAAWVLHVGIFVVWLPAVIASQSMVRDFKQRDFWKATFRACPRWMKHMAYFFFAYTFLNFFICFIAGIGGAAAGESDGDTPSTVFRGFSGHWMAFYSIAMAILYSAAHVREHDDARRCPNGHRVGPSAKFCEECGGEIQETEKPGDSTIFFSDKSH